jgi:hypothetical protein
VTVSSGGFGSGFLIAADDDHFTATLAANFENLAGHLLVGDRVLGLATSTNDLHVESSSPTQSLHRGVKRCGCKR